MVHSAIWGGFWLPMSLRIVKIAHTGQRGVALFFMVSAFTLFLSHDNRRDERKPTRNFFIRRFFRLAPMFYVATVISVVFLPALAGPWRGILLSIFFLHGLSSAAINHGAVGGWSVADEALFYMVLPFLFSLIRNLKSALLWMVGALAICYPLSRVAAAHYPERAEFITLFSFSVEFPIFLFGIVAYFTWKDFIAPYAIRGPARKNLSGMLLLLSAVFYCSFLELGNKALYASSLPYFFLLIALSVYPWPLLVNKATRFLGKISYSFYLLHFVVFLTLQRWAISQATAHPFLSSNTARFVGCFFVTLLLTTPLAYVTWRWVEEPGIHLGRRIITKLEN
jgi:peptidoglycan/LPS O-acetylase OafA/YrhL